MSVCLSACLSIRLSVRLSVNALTEESLPVYGVCLCVCNQGAYTENSADAVDRLLILIVEDSRVTKQKKCLI